MSVLRRSARAAVAWRHGAIVPAAVTLVWLAGGVSSLGARPAPARTLRAASAAEDVVLRGCVERDAASSAAIYRLVTAGVAGAKQYRLTPAPGVEIAPHIGHMVDASGTIAEPSGRARGGRDEPELIVRKILMVANSC